MTSHPQRKRRGGLLGALSKRFSDPRQVGGSIDDATRIIDPKDAMILKEVAVAEVGMEREGEGGELVIAIEVRGTINTTGEQANPLILTSPDGAALLISQIIALAQSGRTGPELDHALVERMKEAISG